MSEITVKVRKPCKHGEVLPHWVDILNGYLGTRAWCTQGDFHVYTPDDLHALVAGVLANQTPRMPIADVADKTDQILDAVQAPLRDGTVVAS